ncbi:glycosyl transferase [Pedobacter yulinensis]|uniref:Glycosyl transferase n=1 Tax=Pedobacter yulinensis TaxID=2126353 RepID=A0A2T3HM03_9SPHI|nr:glycosyltransferase family 4 protein [Pedobacter yulinensis]PST83482.1 glycosyl transferase [Pedobacter yulinensis]
MKIAYISTYPPRACGIATFNQNLFAAMNGGQQNQQSSYVIAMNDGETTDMYEYPEEVKYVVRQENQNDYIKAADYINTSLADAVLLEHEFGIFGGDNGVYVLPLIARLKKPLIVVLHTVLREPSYTQKTIIREIAKYASRILVMSHRAIGFLTDIYSIPAHKIQFVEHGVPDINTPVVNPVEQSLPFKGRKVLLTFGLISRNKGLETVIRALPDIVAKHPEVNYVILGNTHPGVVKSNGEEYRDSLKRLARQLNVENHLMFINKFVEEDELHNYLSAATIYITPYLNEAQITSGTLSYAVGAGAAVLSTPYWHAQELLADNRGELFAFKDNTGLADMVTGLLDAPEKLQRLKENAYTYGLKLRWPQIGKIYINAFREAIREAEAHTRVRKPVIDADMMPTFSLSHVLRLTDDTGIVQHAKYGIPNLKEGYCLDDNARALIMALLSYQQNKSKVALDLLPIYLSYIQYMQREDGNFRNFLSFNRNYLDEVGSEDSFGRTIWALGFLISNAPNNSYKEFAEDLFVKSIPHFSTLQYLRGIANTMIGIAYYLKVNPYNLGVAAELDARAAQLKKAYREASDENWHWFESGLTYDNAILPLALLHHYQVSDNRESLEIALEAMDFLYEKTLSKGYLNPIGNDGWFYKNSDMAVYDQQAIESMAMVLLYYQAYEVTHDYDYIKQMNLCYQWFLGENSLRLPLYDYETKGCGDGLQPHGVNRNQGAESTLAYLISHLMILKALALEHQYTEERQENSSFVA